MLGMTDYSSVPPLKVADLGPKHPNWLAERMSWGP
jgi:hypothetical protein